MNNTKHRNKSKIKNTKDNVMFYIAPILQPHIIEPFCEEDQGHWGQFVDIEPTKPLRIPTKPCSSIDQVVTMNQEKKPQRSPRYDTIEEAPIETPEHAESWFKEYMDQNRQSPSEARTSICSHLELLGKFAWSLLYTITSIDHPIPITNTEEPHPQ